MADPNAPDEQLADAPKSIEAEVFDQALAGAAGKAGIHERTLEALRLQLTEGTRATASQFLEVFKTTEIEDADR